MFIYSKTDEKIVKNSCLFYLSILYLGSRPNASVVSPMTALVDATVKNTTRQPSSPHTRTPPANQMADASPCSVAALFQSRNHAASRTLHLVECSDAQRLTEVCGV